jgi:hypothetical protein
MAHKNANKESGKAILASVRTEMAKPRMARSAKTAELNLDPTRIPEQPCVTMPGIVDKIISSPLPSQPEKAQIAVARADRAFRERRIENMLTAENSDDVTLKKGAYVEITVASKGLKPVD